MKSRPGFHLRGIPRVEGRRTLNEHLLRIALTTRDNRRARRGTVLSLPPSRRTFRVSACVHHLVLQHRAESGTVEPGQDCVSGTGELHMPDKRFDIRQRALRYRERAVEMRRQAATVRTVKLWGTLLEMAELYDEMAEQAERDNRANSGKEDNDDERVIDQRGKC
jgi:hypothetical protein